jgi:hypothetical protein
MHDDDDIELLLHPKITVVGVGGTLFHFFLEAAQRQKIKKKNTLL